jgi:hypothetical protein
MQTTMTTNLPRRVLFSYSSAREHREVTYLPMTSTSWAGLIALLALYLIPAVGAWRERHLGWLLVVLLVPLLGGMAWWVVQIAAMVRPQRHA